MLRLKDNGNATGILPEPVPAKAGAGVTNRKDSGQAGMTDGVVNVHLTVSGPRIRSGVTDEAVAVKGVP
jgi:hypothetical protein